MTVNSMVYKSWIAQSPRAAFLLVHGLGGHSGRWDSLADFFLGHGISSYALDLQGFGETKGLRGHIETLGVYFRDILDLLDIIKKENPGKKIFLIGESLGGLISFSLAILKPSPFDGLICISPAFKNRLKFRLTDYLAFAVFLLINPKKTIPMPFDSAMCTRDTEVLKAIDLDPKECRFASANLLFNTLLAQMRVKSLKNKIELPVLFLIPGSLDQIADPKASKQVFQGLASKDKQILEYPDMLHALSIDLGREKVFNDILNWINRRI